MIVKLYTQGLQTFEQIRAVLEGSTMGEDGVEKFVATRELQSDNSIGSDPLEPGQVWAISPAGRRALSSRRGALGG